MKAVEETLQNSHTGNLRVPGLSSSQMYTQARKRLIGGWALHIIRDISPQAYILSSSDIALGHPTYLPAARLSKGDSLPRQPIEPMHYRTDGSSKKEQKTERSAKIDERALLGISPLFLSINHTSFPLCRLSFFRVSCTGLIPPNPTPFPRVSLPPLAYQSFFFFRKRGPPTFSFSRKSPPSSLRLSLSRV